MLTVDRRFAAPAEAAWELLVDVDAWPRWGQSIQKAAVDGPTRAIELGSRGRVWTPLGVAVPFVITEFDDGRSWGWKVAGVPATRHRVEPLGDGCRVTFAVPWWSAAYLAVCVLALRRMDGLLAS